MTRIAPLLFALACATGPAPEPAAPEAPAAAEPAAAEPAAKPAGDWQAYGADMSADKDVIAAADLLANPASYVDQDIRVEGRVADVCQKMGCWMVVSEGDQSIRVTMKDHAFSVDKQGAGTTCQIDGTLVAKAKDPETIAHFEGEATEGAVIPEKQVEGDVVYELVASGVRMKPTG